MKSKKTAYLAIFTACALILSFVETLIPPVYSAVPGIKIGLPNIIIIYALYKISFLSAFAVSLVRVLLVALLFGNVMTLLYSLAGAVLSLTIMVILKKTAYFSVAGVSVTGAVFHNLGQIIVAILILDTVEIGYYMLVLTLTGVVSGILVGILSAILLKRTKNLKIL